MTTTWEITKNEIKRSQQPTLDSNQFHTTDKSHYYRTIDDADQSRWDHIRETLSPRLVTRILASNQRYEGHVDQMSSLDVLDKVSDMVSNGVAETDIFPLLDSRIEREENTPQQRNRNEFWKTIDQPPKEWVQQDAYLARKDENRIYLVGHGKESPLLESCSKVLQLTDNGEWVEGRMGAGVALEVNGSRNFPYSKVPKDLATKYFDEFQVETNVLKRNDIYLVEYGANEDKAKLFTFPHSDQSESKVQSMTKPYSNLTITKLVEDGQPVNGFEVTPDVEKILLSTQQLTDAQHKDIQMAIVDDSLETALSDLVDETTQLGQ